MVIKFVIIGSFALSVLIPMDTESICLSVEKMMLLRAIGYFEGKIYSQLYAIMIDEAVTPIIMAAISIFIILGFFVLDIVNTLCCLGGICSKAFL